MKYDSAQSRNAINNNKQPLQFIQIRDIIVERGSKLWVKEERERERKTLAEKKDRVLSLFSVPVRNFKGARGLKKEEEKLLHERRTGTNGFSAMKFVNFFQSRC